MKEYQAALQLIQLLKSELNVIISTISIGDTSTSKIIESSFDPLLTKKVFSQAPPRAIASLPITDSYKAYQEIIDQLIVVLKLTTGPISIEYVVHFNDFFARKYGRSVCSLVNFTLSVSQCKQGPLY